MRPLLVHLGMSILSVAHVPELYRVRPKPGAVSVIKGQHPHPVGMPGLLLWSILVYLEMSVLQVPRLQGLHVGTHTARKSCPSAGNFRRGNFILFHLHILPCISLS
jgi:hypothetical protein